MPELNALLTESRRQKSDDRKFLAAVNQIDLDAGETESAWEQVKQRAKERVAEKTGKPVRDNSLDDLIKNGLDYEDLTGGANG